MVRVTIIAHLENDSTLTEAILRISLDQIHISSGLSYTAYQLKIHSSKIYFQNSIPTMVVSQNRKQFAVTTDY